MRRLVSRDVVSLDRASLRGVVAIAAAFVVVAATSSCGGRPAAESEPPAPPAPATSPPPPPPDEITQFGLCRVDASGKARCGARSAATVEVSEVDGGSHVFVQRFDGKDGGRVHVHEGDCPKPGKVVARLGTLEFGQLEVDLRRSYGDLVDGTKSVHIHADKPPHRVVACGVMIQSD